MTLPDLLCPAVTLTLGAPATARPITSSNPPRVAGPGRPHSSVLRELSTTPAFATHPANLVGMLSAPCAGKTIAPTLSTRPLVAPGSVSTIRVTATST